MNKATIKLNNTPEQIELIKATVSPNGETAMKAREAVAAFMGPVIQKVLDLQGVANTLFENWPYNEDDTPTFPLDLYWGVGANDIPVWSQASAGGLGTRVVAGLQEMVLSTYRLDSAVAFNNKTLRRGRLPYVSLGMNRMAQEILNKQEKNKFYIILKALAEARTNAAEHLIQSTTANILQLDDFNRLLTLSKRQNAAFQGGTADSSYSNGVTDLYMSPEMMESIRAMAYNPQNTTAIPNTDESTAVPLPDSIREEIYRNAGTSSIYGKALHEMLEFGTNRSYNTIFDSLYSGTITFATANQELVLGVDRSRQYALLRPVAQNADAGSEFVTQVDDQWSKRADRVGWFGALNEGAIVIDARVLGGIIIA